MERIRVFFVFSVAQMEELTCFARFGRMAMMLVIIHQSRQTHWQVYGPVWVNFVTILSLEIWSQLRSHLTSILKYDPFLDMLPSLKLTASLHLKMDGLVQI